MRRLKRVVIWLALIFSSFSLGYFMAQRTAPGSFDVAPDRPVDIDGGALPHASEPPPSLSPSPGGADSGASEPAPPPSGEDDAPNAPALPSDITQPGDADAQWQPINLNTASVEELQDLPGIGPKIAERILNWRKEHGGFRDITQIMEVSGIGEKTFEKMKDMITV